MEHSPHLDLHTHTISTETYESLVRHARRRGAGADAEDVVHDVIERVLEGRFDGHAAAELRPLLFRSVTHRHIDLVRRRRREVDGEGPDRAAARFGEETEDGAVDRLDVAALLDALDDERRQICEAVMHGAGTRSEIAAAVGLSRDQLYRRLESLRESPQVSAHRAPRSDG